MAFKIDQFSIDFQTDRGQILLSENDGGGHKTVIVAFPVKDQSGKDEKGLRKEAEKAARKALKDALDALDALSES